MSLIKVNKKLINDIVDLEYKTILKISLYKKHLVSKNSLKAELTNFIHGALKCGVFTYTNPIK